MWNPNNIKVYPLQKRWRKIRPFLSNPDVQEYEEAAFSCIHPEYKAGLHVPREAGWGDSGIKGISGIPFPRTRTCLRAYQSFGRCHQIAPVMLALINLAEPKGEWWIEGSIDHTVVIGRIGKTMYLVDINMVGYSDDEVIESYYVRIDHSDWCGYNDCPEDYLKCSVKWWRENHRSLFPIYSEATGGQPLKGWEQHYPNPESRGE